MLRVGDIALLYAEIINETEGATDEALKYLNMVRSRAGIREYTSADLTSRYQFRMAVRDERRVELSFENSAGSTCCAGGRPCRSSTTIWPPRASIPATTTR